MNFDWRSNNKRRIILGETNDLLDSFAKWFWKQISLEHKHLILFGGGATPLLFFPKILKAYEKLPSKPDLSHLHLSVTDERHCPWNDQASNSGTLQKHFIGHFDRCRPSFLGFPYDEDFSRSLQKVRQTHQDLRPFASILGLGLDGHTASLFPSQAHTLEDDPKSGKETSPIHSGGIGPEGLQRLTWSAKALCESQLVVFVILGEQKAEISQKILEGPYLPKAYPAQQIHGQRETYYFLDTQASSRLKGAYEAI